MHPALYSHIGASYHPNPYLGTYSEFDYYTGALPNPIGMAYDLGLGIGQAARRNVPAVPFSSNRGSAPSSPNYDDRSISSTDWSGVAKVALVVGGAAAIYFIYRASKAASPVAERLGGVAGKLAMARVGGANRFAQNSNDVVSSRKLLTA